MRKDHHFLPNMVILLIFTLKRDYHWGAKSCHWEDRRRAWGGELLSLPCTYIGKKVPDMFSSSTSMFILNRFVVSKLGNFSYVISEK